MLGNLIALGTAAALLSAPLSEAEGDDADVSMIVLEDWSNVFGGRPAEFHCTITAKKSFRGRAGWALAVGRATVARGEASVSAGPQKTETINVRFDVPQLKEGVVMPAVLSVACYAANADAPAGSLNKPLWIFPQDPFANRSQWLKQLDIHLFDPAGKTRQVFLDAGIPFSETRNVDSLGALEGGLLVIGEGTSLEEYRGLPRIAATTAAQGVPVLCLAPASGQFTVPGLDQTDPLPRATRVSFRRADVIRDLDKRLDAQAWPPDGEVAAASLAVKSDRGRVIAQVVEGDADWPWLEIGFSAERGKLIVCGFGLMSKWNAGPTPRFLFARLLDTMTTDSSNSVSQGELP